MKFSISLFFLSLFVSVGQAEDPTDWKNRLYTPTQIDKIGDHYFIVVCWHHRILYNDSLDPDISRWQVLDDEIAGPHSIDSDGTFYVAEDTGRHRLKVYRREGDQFSLIQELGPFGKRTHRVRYDEATRAFYVISSNSQHLTKLVVAGDRLEVVYTKELPILEGAYTRSLSIYDDHLYFTSGPGVITKVRYRDDSYEPVARYRVPEGMKSANDIFRSGDGWWYLTATPQRIVRARSLEALDKGDYEDLYGELGLQGTPYYLARFDGRFFVPQITQHSGVLSFTHDERGKITDLRTHFDFGPPNASDRERILALPR